MDYKYYLQELQVYHAETLTLAQSMGITLDDRALTAALSKLATAAPAIACYAAQLAYVPLPDSYVSALNRVLFSAERSFLLSNGLPKRPYFKHAIQAPGFDDGYGAEVFPGVKQALREADAPTAQQQLAQLAQVVGVVATQLLQAVPVSSGCVTGSSVE